MSLSHEALDTLSTEIAEQQAILTQLEHISIQAEVFSDQLLIDRLFSPRKDDLARFEKAFAPFGPMSIQRSERISSIISRPKSLRLDLDVTPPPGDPQELFDTFLTCGNSHMNLDPTQATYYNYWQVGHISAGLYITCPLPSSYLDLLASMGKIITNPGHSYQSINCTI